jgi:hypothetical protein
MALTRRMEIRGFEPLTYGLQSRRSSQLSYIPQLREKKGIGEEGTGSEPWRTVVRLRKTLTDSPLRKPFRIPARRNESGVAVRTIERRLSLKGGDPAALSSTATLLRLHPPY